MSRRPTHVESDVEFQGAFREVRGPAVAWHVLGWETRPDEDTEWTGQESRTGRVVAVMVGDDRRFTFDTSDLVPLVRSEYCGGCGQIGCHCDAYQED